MSNLEYHLPPLTEEERERGRRRMLPSVSCSNTVMRPSARS